MSRLSTLWALQITTPFYLPPLFLLITSSITSQFHLHQILYGNTRKLDIDAINEHHFSIDWEFLLPTDPEQA